MINAALEESRRWGRPRSASSEYKTYSESQVTVYVDDLPVSSTDDGVRLYTYGDSDVVSVHIC